MANSNSSLVTDILLLKNHFTKQKEKKVKKYTPHHAAGKTTVKGMYNTFSSREASANYGIAQGKIALYVNEKDRAWTSSNKQDAEAITAEVANSKGEPYWEIADVDVKNIINLGVDICKRNGLKGFTWTGDANGTLTVHRMFKATACPGPYLYALMPWIATEITGRVNGVIKGEIIIPKVNFNAGNKVVVKNSVVVKKPEPQKFSYVYGGVDMSPVFDYVYYANRYPDLMKAYGLNEASLFYHFCTCGMNEARQAKENFDPVFYRKMNTDVENIYKNNWKGYYAHYCNHGIAEGRKGAK